jgi:DNA modification methylase
MGSGTTGIAANLEGFNFIGIDMVEEYVGIARARIAHSGEYVITEDLTMKRIKQPSIFDWVPINE